MYCKTPEMTQEQIKAAAAAEQSLRLLVKALAETLPGVTFGYVGNFESWGDDRSFHIFLPTPGRVGTYGDSVSLGSFAKLPEAVTKWVAIAECAAKRYNDGSRRV